MENEKTVTVTIELSSKEAMALAQFCKRSRFETFHECAVGKDEAYVMIDSINKVKSSLREEGFSPR